MCDNPDHAWIDGHRNEVVQFYGTLGHISPFNTVRLDIPPSQFTDIESIVEVVFRTPQVNTGNIRTYRITRSPNGGTTGSGIGSILAPCESQISISAAQAAQDALDGVWSAFTRVFVGGLLGFQLSNYFDADIYDLEIRIRTVPKEVG